MSNQQLDQLAKLKHQFDSRAAGKIATVLGRLSQQNSTTPNHSFNTTRPFSSLRYHRLPNCSRRRKELRSFSPENRPAAALRVPTCQPSMPRKCQASPAPQSPIHSLTTLCVGSSRHIHRRWASDWVGLKMSTVWPKPGRDSCLLEEDARGGERSYVELAARCQKRSARIAWLVERFRRLPITEEEQSELYNAQKLYVRWLPAYIESNAYRHATARAENFLSSGSIDSAPGRFLQR